MKYRSRSDLVGLLDAANGGGATKTKLMYKAYLSFNQLRVLLVENDLIEYEVGQTYRTTEKGMRLLYLQNKIHEVAPDKGNKASCQSMQLSVE
jgi:predicted transcriptional regulator